jgi:hypothetical protein
MATAKKLKIPSVPAPSAARAESLRAVAEDHGLTPVTSPAHELQQALHDAGYRSQAFQQRPMSNAMLVLTLICVYALAMMMLLGSFSA